MGPIPKSLGKGDSDETQSNWRPSEQRAMKRNDPDLSKCIWVGRGDAQKSKINNTINFYSLLEMLR